MSCAYMRSVPIRRIIYPVKENPLWSVIASLLSGTAAIIISLPLLSALLLVLPLCAGLRWLLYSIYRRQLQNESQVSPERMIGAEARWVNQRSVLHAVLVLDGREAHNVNHFHRILSTRLLPAYPRLTRIPVKLPMSAGGGHCWLPDTEFSLNHHVLPADCPIHNHHDLQLYVAKLLEKELPQHKPPWQFHILLPSAKQKDTVAIVRVHQSIADGSTLLRVLCHSLADSPTMDIIERPQFGSLAFGLNVFRACLTGPCTLLIWLWLTVGDCNPMTQRSNWTGAFTMTWSASIMLPKIMRIKQVTRSTVNCVILSALAGALRVLLQRCGVRQPPNVKVLVPTDVRSQRTSKANSTSLGNKSASMVIPLPVSVEGCVPRLWATRATLATLRTTGDPILLYLATAALMAMAPGSTGCYLLDLLADKTSLQFSSLSGPTSHLTIGGDRLKDVYCLLPATAHVGMSVTAITYADQVSISVAAQGALGPTAQLLLAQIENQIETMWTLLLNRRVPGENRVSCISFTRDIEDSPLQDIENRLSEVQREVARLNEDPEGGQEAILADLKAEFVQLVRALKKLQGNQEASFETEIAGKTRKRALSCSMSKRHSVISFKSFLSSRASTHVLEIEKGLDRQISNSKMKTLVHVENETQPIQQYISTPISQQHRKNSYEIVRDQNKRKNFPPVINNWTSTSGVKEELAVNVIVDAKGSESEDGTMDTETDYSDDTIKISSDDEMEYGYQDFKTTGPINRNLRDLYYSNYLEYKLDRLKEKECKLNQKISEKSSQVFYPDIEDADKDVLI